MARESNIPLFLWIATAVLAHLAWGGGADRVVHVLEQRLDVQRFALAVQKQARLNAAPLEVALLEEEAHEEEPLPDDPEAVDAPERDPEELEDTDEDEAKPEEDESTKQETKPDKQAEPKEKPPELELKKAEKKKEEEKKEEATVKQLPAAQMKNRIAVRQHVKDEDQENPDAEFIADHANKVEKQTQARITSTNQNSAEPSPGGNFSGPTDNPGNAVETRVAQSEDAPGEADRAPLDDKAGSEKGETLPTPPSAGTPSGRQVEATAHAEERQGPDNTPDQPAAAQKGQKAQMAARAVEARPETVNSGAGSFSVPGQREAQAAQKARRAKKKRLPPPKRRRSPSDLLGLGSRGTTENGVNLNLSPKAALAAVGQDRLKEERTADAQRRRSTHRGSWRSLGIEKWRAAIENYVPSVQPGNQTALNTARVPFASYLNTIHNRLHPVFADSFLGSLGSLPGNNPMNKRDLKTHLEIVLGRDDGRVVRMGVTKTSGVTAFDIAALESVQRASPYGQAPSEIVSPDGNVYLHWEFHRNPYYACSTYFARPYMLKVKPKTAPPNVKPPPARPYDGDERPPPDEGQRHGWLMPSLQTVTALR